jgi:hypothetical protein
VIDGGRLPPFGRGREQRPGERLHRTRGESVLLPEAVHWPHAKELGSQVLLA